MTNVYHGDADSVCISSGALKLFLEKFSSQNYGKNEFRRFHRYENYYVRRSGSRKRNTG